MRLRYLRTFLFKSLVVLGALVAAISCSSGKPSDNQTPAQKDSAAVSAPGAPASAGTGQYSIEIAPADATRRSMLSLLSKGFNLSEAKIEWLVNGMPVSGANTSLFNASQTKKGDVVSVRVTAKGAEMRSNDVVIKNSPPEITGGHFQLSGNTITADVTAADADDDSVTLTYAWTVNDKPAGKDKTLDSKVKRGDRISVRIVPSDGESEGRPVVLTSEARNVPPAISEQKDVKFDGKVWTCQLKATDSDSDQLTFALKSALAGMTIDPNTGLMTWHVPEGFKGKTSCIAMVKDSYGGEASYTVNIDITR